jgi:3-methylcrotonyl-CoA carboxylase alpha subunit
LFEKILIANRGEIACRVIRTARRLGIGTVAVYSDADVHALHVRTADEAVHIGAAPPGESYLRGDRIVRAALDTGAQAIHPGYGFLSENAGFAQLCADSGIVFIGPTANAIAAMGSKSAAKRLMETAGVPLVPGYHGDDQSDAVLLREAELIGYPVLLKAVAGGGGKGMRRVERTAEFADALASARRESTSAFGNSDMLVEKCLVRPRHVEIQVFCDNHGNAVHLFERDCSVQRRHQKIIEEAPAPGMTDALRAAMGDAAVRAARAIDYRGAGTVEFLLDADGAFYFMEMNTRLQVEHPVTEMITRQDLVEWQLRVAAGEPLPRAQHELSIHGHSLEVRIYAEDPARDFLPSVGRLNYLQPPHSGAHLRVDTGVAQGDSVGVYYDPMIAKLIVHDEDRPRALRRLRRALRDYRVAGVTTNIAFLSRVAACADFASGAVHTSLIDDNHDALFQAAPVNAPRRLALAALYLLLKRRHEARRPSRHVVDRWSPWRLADAWRGTGKRQQRLEILLDGQRHVLLAEYLNGDASHGYRLHVAGQSVLIDGHLHADQLDARIDGHRRCAAVAEQHAGHILFDENGSAAFTLASLELETGEASIDTQAFAAPMTGSVVAIAVEPGRRVEKGDTLLVIEAMKMEFSIRAPAAGKVKEFRCAKGELVEGGFELLTFDPE